MSTRSGGESATRKRTGEGVSGVPEGTYCPRCGADAGGGTGACPGCGLDTMGDRSLTDLVSTARKDRDRGTGLVRRFLFLLPLAVWRQRRIEGAQRVLIEHKIELRERSSLHCRACGEPLDHGEATCSECGARSDLAVIDDVEFDVHDPTATETTVSNRWWLGVIGGPALGLAGGIVAGALEVSAAPLLVVAGSVAAVLGWYVDGQYLRATTTWNPPYWFYLPVLLVPVVNLLGAVYYVRKRRSLLGTDA